MLLIATDGVPQSVCLSVGQICKPAKTAELIKMPFRRLTRVGPKNHVLDGVKIPHGKGQFWGCTAHLTALGVSVSIVVYAAKGSISRQ